MRSLSLFGQIQEQIDYQLRSSIQRSKLNMNDKAVNLEDLLGRVLNELTGKNFHNTNEDVANFGAIDFIDEANHSVLQVTVQQKNLKAKKEKTIADFLKNPAYKDCTSLQILFLNQKDISADLLKKVSIRKNCTYEGINVIKLLAKVKMARPSVKEKILELLEEEDDRLRAKTKKATVDPAALKAKIQQELDRFINLKYFSNTHKSVAPFLSNRKVKRHNREIRFNDKDLEQTGLAEIKKMEVVIGEFSSLILAAQPTFLFGELGSGKSTIVARFLMEENKLSESINLLIPANAIKGKVGDTPESLLALIANYFKEQLITSELPELNHLLTQYQVTIAFDGLDELRLAEAGLLLQHLQKLNGTYARLTLIGTGRPIELRSIIHLKEWNCLSVIDLSLAEIREMLVNEAKAADLNESAAIYDADKRLAFLKMRTDLMTIAITPLVITLIRDYLVDDSADLTLGGLLYKVLKERLSWDEPGQQNSGNLFFKEFPNIFQREKYIALVAQGIAASTDNTISEERLFKIAEQFIGADTSQRTKVVDDSLSFVKKTFLQQQGTHYSFVSQPLYDTCLALYIAEHYPAITADSFYLENNWRAVSGAAAVIRARGGVDEARQWFTDLLGSFLNEPDHTTISAIIVQELHDQQLANTYIDLLRELGYRPLRIWTKNNNDWDDPDTFSPVAIAYALTIAGENGFDWFFEEYLSLRHYMHMNETGMNANILLHYLAKNKYVLPQKRLEKLKPLIAFHIRFTTFSCSNLVPVLALILPEEFEIRQRCLALVTMLAKYTAYDHARTLITQLVQQGHLYQVIDAVETLATEGQFQKPEVISLWFELSQPTSANMQILNAAIKVKVNGDQTLASVIDQRYGKDHFISLLKYLCLESGVDSDEAAILLYELTGSKSFYLVGRPILLASKWHHGNDHRRKEILEKIIARDPLIVRRAIADNLIIRKGETPLLGFEYFIKAILHLEDDYTSKFIYAISFLPKYCLTRNPELRFNLQQLFEQKTGYRKALSSACGHMDMVLRENAIKITIACLPGDCKTELETYLLGLLNVNLMDNEEWIGFLYKLDFSKAVLNHIYERLGEFTTIGKTMALALLFYHGFALDASEMQTLTEGLVNEGSGIDRSERGSERKRIIEDPRFLPGILKILYEDQDGRYDCAASMLQSYFVSQLSFTDLAYVYAIQAEKHHLYLFEFDKLYNGRLEEPGFKENLQLACQKVRELLKLPEAFIEIYLRAITGDKKAWVTLFEKMLFEKEHYEEYVLFHLYRWAIEKRKTHPDLTRLIGEVALEMIDYPAIQQGERRNSPAVHLLIVADEFASAPKEKFLEVLFGFEAKDDLVAVAAYRLGKIPDRIRTRRDGSFLYLFKENKTASLRSYSPAEVDQYLFKGGQVPGDADLFIKSVILYGLLEGKQTGQLQNSGLGSLLAAVLDFIYKDDIQFDDMVDAMDKLENNRSVNRFQELIYLLKEIKLHQPGGKQAYIKSLEKKITLNKRIFLGELTDFFIELFALNVPLNTELLQVLLDELLFRAYLLDHVLLDHVCYYTAHVMPPEQAPAITNFLRLHIQAIIHNTDKGHHDDYLQVCWLFSLMLLFLEKKNDDIANMGFLMGLQCVFIQNSKRAYRMPDQQWAQFKGRDFLLNSDVLLREIPAPVLRHILQIGLTVPMPEINALCRFFQAFNPDVRATVDRP